MSMTLQILELGPISDDVQTSPLRLCDRINRDVNLLYRNQASRHSEGERSIGWRRGGFETREVNAPVDDANPVCDAWFELRYVATDIVTVCDEHRRVAKRPTAVKRAGRVGVVHVVCFRPDDRQIAFQSDACCQHMCCECMRV